MSEFNNYVMRGKFHAIRLTDKRADLYDLITLVNSHGFDFKSHISPGFPPSLVTIGRDEMRYTVKLGEWVVLHVVDCKMSDITILPDKEFTKQYKPIEPVEGVAS